MTTNELKEKYTELRKRCLELQKKRVQKKRNKNNKQMTQFEEFISTVPKWDGTDRVTELKRLANVTITMYARNKARRDANSVRTLIEEVCRDNSHRFCYFTFYGKQGIGKSFFARWLFPFYEEETPFPFHERWTGMVTNGCLIMESEDRPSRVPSLFADNMLYILCEIEAIDFSYTNIDIKQLYAQVLAEEKE